MKTWRDCRSETERAEVVAQVFRSYRTVERAAAALGITRRYLTKMLAPGEARRLRENMQTHETSENSENAVHATPAAKGERSSSENRTQAESLTYADALPTFRHVSSATANHDVESLMLSGVPRIIKDWLQEKALRRVQANGGRFALSPVVVEILERARREEEGQ